MTHFDLDARNDFDLHEWLDTVKNIQKKKSILSVIKPVAIEYHITILIRWNNTAKKLTNNITANVRPFFCENI